MENNNIPINKIVSILVAIIVTGCVLVPICNGLGQSSGNGGGSDNDSDILGNRMSEWDMSDTSKTITFTDDGNWNVGDVVVYYVGEWYDDISGDSIETVSNSVVYTEVEWNGQSYYGFTPIIMGFQMNSVLEMLAGLDENAIAEALSQSGLLFKEITLKYPEYGSGWVLTPYEDDDEGFASIEDDAQLYVYDSQGELSVQYGKSVDDLALTDTSRFELINGYISMSYTNMAEYISNKVIIGTGEIAEDTIISFIKPTTFNPYYPEVVREGNILSIENADGTIEVNGDSKPFEGAYIFADTYVAGSAGGNSGSDSGIAGTLITIIPVFVLLAILGMIAKMFVDKRGLSE